MISQVRQWKAIETGDKLSSGIWGRGAIFAADLEVETEDKVKFSLFVVVLSGRSLCAMWLFDEFFQLTNN